MGLVLLALLVYGPLIAVAWFKVGALAGIIATALFALLAFVQSQPGGHQLLGGGSGGWRTSSRAQGQDRNSATHPSPTED